ncbi:MAG: ATP-binding cassette domain-containing protein, partial [Rubrivivax sp.]
MDKTTASHGRVDVRDLHIRFHVKGQSVEAVRSANVHVRPGEFVSLIGPSGCGKSTLMNAVAGFIKPDGGQVLLDGQEVDGPGSDRGVVFQQYSLFPW